jgi:UDP-N-acetylmuramoyl-tripeptide--D-alanyl-D-alanine ligase
MKRLTAAEIATALNGELYGIDPETPLTAGVVTDSREVGPGDIYVARRGASFDGIEFAAAAVEAGAALIIGESVPTVDERAPAHRRRGRCHRGAGPVGQAQHRRTACRR